MKWLEGYALDIGVWHRWWAWYPVYIDGTVWWLENIERRRVIAEWEFRPPCREIYLAEELYCEEDHERMKR